jgi:hypothetical protein
VKNMPEDNRPVTYQQTLGIKTERISKETKEQNQNSDFDKKNLKQADTTFPE